MAQGVGSGVAGSITCGSGWCHLRRANVVWV